MDVGEFALLLLSLALTAFTLGAVVAWRLEERRPVVAPFWLVVTRNVSWMAWVIYILVAVDPPSRIFTVDPLWWSLIEAAMVVGLIVVFVLDVRHAWRNRSATGASPG
jgi:hypothetical protein